MISLIGELDRKLGLCQRFADCFDDRRDPLFVEHSLLDLVRQRVFGLAAGYEDLNDHDELRRDPLLAACVGKEDVLGQQRAEHLQGTALAGKSTLNRLELAPAQGGHYHKFGCEPEAMEEFFIEAGVENIPGNCREIILDFDATDDLIHGLQEGRFFHGYYRNYCYLPLYCFCGGLPLFAKLRQSNIDPAEGTLEALQKIVGAIRRRFGNKKKIIVRADSGFCRDELLDWCERHAIYYCIGLARNARLEQLLAPTRDRAVQMAILTGGRATSFGEFEYRTLKSWSRARRVIGKAQIMPDKDNPRFVVTNLPRDGFEGDAPERFAPKNLYRELYCARGEMENRIKEQQLGLFADRTSTHWIASNQLRLWFSTLAYLLVELLRARALGGTKLAHATVSTIRQHLFKIAAVVKVSVRRVLFEMCSSFPLQRLWALAHQRIRMLPQAAAG